MKGCRQCGYAFFDRSKNRSAAWCAMSICGNRTKNRAYYRRRGASIDVRRAGRSPAPLAALVRRRAPAAVPRRRQQRAALHGPGGGLRDHGARPEHRRGLRRAARPRLRRVLRDRRARRRVLRLRVLGRRSASRRRASTSTSWSSSGSRSSPTTIAGVLIGVPTLRLRGDYIGIVTLAFGEIIGQVASNGREIELLRRVAHRRAARHVRRSTGSTCRSWRRSARSTCAPGTGSRSRSSR